MPYLSGACPRWEATRAPWASPRPGLQLVCASWWTHSPHPGLDFCRPLSALPQTVPIERGRGGEGVKREVGEGDGILKPASKRLINSLNKCALKADHVPDLCWFSGKGATEVAHLQIMSYPFILIHAGMKSKWQHLKCSTSKCLRSSSLHCLVHLWRSSMIFLMEFSPFLTSIKIKKQRNVWWNMPSSWAPSKVRPIGALRWGLLAHCFHVPLWHSFAIFSNSNRNRWDR